MKAYENISEERLTALITEFLQWSGGDVPKHNIWDSTDACDDDIPKVYYFCEDLTDEDEKELIEDAQSEEWSPEFEARFDKIVEQIQSTWK